MGIHAENKKSLKLLEFQGFGGDYWTRTSDLMRVNGLGKLFLTDSNPIQHRRLRIQNYLTAVYPGVSAHSAPHCGYSCGQKRFPPDAMIRGEAFFLFIGYL